MDARSSQGMAKPISLPMVDLSDPDVETAGKALIKAAVTYGFLYIDSRTTGFTKDHVNQAFDTSKEFFAQPNAAKEPFRRGPDNRGWVGMHVETLDPEHHQLGDFKEALNIGELKDGKFQQPLPATIISREKEIARFTDLCNDTCARILALLAHGLEISSDFFTSRHDPSGGSTGNSLRLLYYPPRLPSFRPEKDIRAGAHSDYGSITLLFQCPGQPGLEILTPDEKWAPVPVYPDDSVKYPFPPILVNMGDMLSYWTDGLLKSTIHRVVFPDDAQSDSRSKGQDRYSIAFFCQPVSSTELIPVPSKIVAAYRQQKARDGSDGSIVGYGGGAGRLNSDESRMTAGEHLQARLNATFSKGF
ncbi:hypothetical protein N7532_007623 [Penicillium argentinense]|uniref:Fe2OG dioxygenase domain-containing protein n=1 Tax=Penicillium argentinense TaxID=1131581 RepID=A0A9W9EW11_9EURO|nr:uncharacterized protein N7532_007623 [Penicillium argentinense]KAJ5088939.1 hypothetical protein N7532_007623 [Penicillium argentinense]